MTAVGYDVPVRPQDLKALLKRHPFTPVQIGLTDGRSVLVRHPDQAVVTHRSLFVGLASLTRSRPLATPGDADTIAREWLLVDLLHVATAEPLNSAPAPRRRRPGRK